MVFSKIRVDGPVALVGGGALTKQDLLAVLQRSRLLVAADSGADQALTFGHCPDWVIGDLDSLSDAARNRIPAARIRKVVDQDTTDFEKCLERLACPRILAVGFLGGRVDHALAMFNALVRHPRGHVVVIGKRDVCVHLPKSLRLAMTAGDRLSLFPMAQVRGRSCGLEWPIDGLEFSPGGRSGTSNRALGFVTLEMEAAGMLLIIARTKLDVLLSALDDPDHAITEQE